MVSIRQVEESDFDYFSPRINQWWGGRSMSAMVPRLWFKDFRDTSIVAEDETGKPVGFLVGYVSPNNRSKAYIHFVGVDPEYRGRGLGKSLYLRFREATLSAGCSEIHAVTAPVNNASLAFHEAMGFVVVEPNGTQSLPTQAQGVKDYDGPGEDRVLLLWTPGG